MHRLVLLGIALLHSCWQADENRALDVSAHDIRLTIAPDLKTATLASMHEGVPKRYRLQLHAVINYDRPLSKDAGGNFLPLAFTYVVFSYWQAQPPAVYTCVLQDVVIGVPHPLQTNYCTAGEALRQEMRACVADDTQHLNVAASPPHQLSCGAAEPPL